MAHNKIIPLHRGIQTAAARPQGGRDSPPSRPANVRDIEARLRDDRPDMFEALRARRPSLIERIGDALDSPFAVGVYVGTYLGCLLTVGLAMLWSLA